MNHLSLGVLAALALSACAGLEGGAAPDAPATQSAIHAYQATASVGDFLLVTIDKANRTVSYENRTNGLTATGVGYTVDARGVYSFTGDPNGHLRQAIELEDEVLVADVDHAGPGRDTRALAVGAATQPIDPAAIHGGMLTMQFRTQNGGMEVGHVDLGRSGQTLTVDYSGYWPRGAMMTGSDAFNSGPGSLTLPGGGAQGSLTITESKNGVTSTDTLFKVTSGYALDMSNGNMFMLDRSASKAFDPARAGDYQALAYAKVGARGTSDATPEPGTPSVVLETITIDAAGHVTVSQGGQTVASSRLVPVADVAALTGAGKLDPTRCNGLFTFEGGSRQVFVLFSDKGLLFTSFSPGADDSYDYAYGAAVRL